MLAALAVVIIASKAENTRSRIVAIFYPETAPGSAQ